MSIPKISVITAVYSGEKYLAEAIESILNQTFKDFEYIIINDSSKDNSLKIINDYMKKDKRIILINNKKNTGSTKSRNNGLKKAKGRYIAILDQDDIALPKRLEKEYNFLEKNKDIFLVGSGAINIYENGEKTTRFKPITDPRRITKLLPRRCRFYHPSVMYRNQGHLYYRDKIFYADDYDFYLRLLSENKDLANLKEPLIKYRINSTGSSWKNFSKMELFAQRAKEFYFQRLKYGKDDYDRFDPNEILNIDVENSMDKFILGCEIKASFKINDFKKCRALCKKYFEFHGYLNKITIYYFACFLGKEIINYIRKTVFIHYSYKF